MLKRYKSGNQRTRFPCLKYDDWESTRSAALNYCPDNSPITYFQCFLPDAALAQLLNL